MISVNAQNPTHDHSTHLARRIDLKKHEHEYKMIPWKNGPPDHVSNVRAMTVDDLPKQRTTALLEDLPDEPDLTDWYIGELDFDRKYTIIWGWRGYEYFCANLLCGNEIIDPTSDCPCDQCDCPHIVNKNTSICKIYDCAKCMNELSELQQWYLFEFLEHAPDPSRIVRAVTDPKYNNADITTEDFMKLPIVYEEEDGFNLNDFAPDMFEGACDEDHDFSFWSQTHTRVENIPYLVICNHNVPCATAFTIIDDLPTIDMHELDAENLPYYCHRMKPPGCICRRDGMADDTIHCVDCLECRKKASRVELWFFEHSKGRCDPNCCADTHSNFRCSSKYKP